MNPGENRVGGVREVGGEGQEVGSQVGKKLKTTGKKIMHKHREMFRIGKVQRGRSQQK